MTVPILALLAVACTGDREGPDPVGDRRCTPGDLVVVAGRPGLAGLGVDGAPADETTLFLPQDVTPHPDGRWWIADYNDHLVREVGQDGISRVVLGAGMPGGGEGGPALDERLDHPTMVAPDPADPDVLWVAATGNHRVGRLDLAASWIEWPYGTGYAGFMGDGGPASEAWFWRPSSVAFDASGTIYVSDRMNQVVRAIGADGIVRTVAGTPQVSGYTGDGGPATEATLNAPPETETDPGNRLDVVGDRLVLADTGNGAVREVDLASGLIRTLASGLSDPHDVAIGADGVVYVAETGASCIRAIEADGALRTVAGICGQPGPAVPSAPAEEATLASPTGVAVGEDGVLWVADRDNHVIRRICR